MARLEEIRFHPHVPTVMSDKVVWHPASPCWKVERLPQIFWSNGTAWREANLWAHERAVDNHKVLGSVRAGMTALLSYAQWLEQTGVNWWDFPERKKDRCLVRYRSTLINARENGELAPSTVSERMRVVISFYRWLKAHGLLSTEWPMWRDRIGLIKWADSFGMERTLRVLSSELSIPNRKVAGDGPEAGLFPVATTDRDALLAFTMQHGSEELFMLLSLGFFTGMRLGTLADLKIDTLVNAVPDPRCNDLYRLALGPGARPPVATKFGVSGNAFIPRILLNLLRDYVVSPRRLLREAKAESTNKRLVFLTKYGNPYAQRGVNKSVAINVEMWALRRRAFSSGIEAAKGFWFHQTRATFGTELARIALKYGNTQEAVSLVKEALLQRDESSALHYIRFVEKTPIKIEVANEFTRSFLGIFGNTGGEDAR